MRLPPVVPKSAPGPLGYAGLRLTAGRGVCKGTAALNHKPLPPTWPPACLVGPDVPAGSMVGTLDAGWEGQV